VELQIKQKGFDRYPKGYTDLSLAPTIIFSSGEAGACCHLANENQSR